MIALPKGVPPLLNKVGTWISTGEWLLADAQEVLGLFEQPQWGLYLDGAPALDVDSTLALEVKRDYRVASYPMEQGAFQSYDKVQEPLEITVTVTKGGSVAERAALLKALDAAAAALTLYSVLMPDRTIDNAAIRSYETRRTARNGAALLTVEIRLIEIRQTVNALFNAATPAGADPAVIGQVQATAVPPEQAAEILKGVS